MNNNEKAWLWLAQDNSDGEVLTEKLGIRFRDAEEAQEFKTHFEAAQVFNTKSKAGESDLVIAETVADIKEEADNPDENVSAETGGS
jgi:hypothetical protein